MTPSPQRVAVVTGGGTGIGAAISAAFADAGYAVVLGQSSARHAADNAARLAAPGRVLTGVGADLSTAEGTQALVAAAVAAHGRIDVLVNNAGVTGPAALATIEDCTDAQIDAIFDVNLKAPLRLVRAALPHLAAGSVIVNISSVAATSPQAGAVAYGASKAGLNHLTRCLALELAPRGIRCVWVSPGDIRIEREQRDRPADTAPDPAADPAAMNLAGVDPAAADPAALDRAGADRAGGLARFTPLGRRGEVADVAAAVLWLCGPAASFVTGTGLVVDGGWSAL